MNLNKLHIVFIITSGFSIEFAKVSLLWQPWWLLIESLPLFASPPEICRTLPRQVRRQHGFLEKLNFVKKPKDYILFFSTHGVGRIDDKLADFPHVEHLPIRVLRFDFCDFVNMFPRDFPSNFRSESRCKKYFFVQWVHLQPPLLVFHGSSRNTGGLLEIIRNRWVSEKESNWNHSRLDYIQIVKGWMCNSYWYTYRKTIL